jgi:DNA-binding FadR family transcriptional regulator
LSHSTTFAVDPPETGATLAPLRLRTAGEQIAERLVTAIALGEFVPGQRLPTERELSALLGVNRTSVRDALHRLAEAGYVDIQRGRHGGAYVRTSWGAPSAEMIRRTLVPSWGSFEALFDLRSLLEPLIARAAAERRTAGDLDAVDRALVDYVEAPDRDASRAADRALHEAVARAAHNVHLESLSREIRAQVSLGFEAEPFSAEIRALAVSQHRELVAAIRAGDGDAAARISRTHFALTETALRSLLARVAGAEEPVRG